MKDIAEQAGLSVMTVSMSLRGVGRVAEKTREKVKRIARELGYVPDPALSALINHKIDRRKVKANSQLAFLTNFETAEGWREEVYISRYFDGARSRAGELGYSLENFWLGERRMTSDRMCQILEARGIQGLLVAPIEEASSVVEFAWDRFCSVSLCRNLIQPKINTVDHNHHYSMKMAWAELMKRGYKKIGYCIRRVSEDIADYHWLGSHQMQQETWMQKGKAAFVEPLVMDEIDFDAFKAWLTKEKPEVVVSPHIIVYEWLKELGYNLPEDIGFLHLEANPEARIAGIRQNFFQVGVVAVDLLHLEIMRSERGMPPIRQSISIDGRWVEGETLRTVLEVSPLD